MTYYSQPQSETPARRQQGQVCRLQKTISAVLVAAGSSTRMGFDKLSFDLGGETVLHRSIRAFDQCPQIGEIVLVAGKNRAFVEQQTVGCTKPARRGPALCEPGRHRGGAGSRCPLRSRRPGGAGQGHHQAGRAR